MLLRMSDFRKDHREWLLHVLETTGMSGTALAIKAGLAQTTITRFLNDAKHGHALSARTIAAIETASGLSYGTGEPRQIAASLRESEAEPYTVGPSGDPIATMLEPFGRANGIDPWLLTSRALEGIGFFPGDVLIVDMNREAKPGDIVCAQVYDWANSRAETVFRVLEPPYLLAASREAGAMRPTVVDNQNVMVRGVVIASVRPRQARAA